MIPPVAHLIWFGRRLPWAHALAAVSAARRGGFSRVVLHHADALEAGPGPEALRQEARVELRRLDPLAVFAGLGPLAAPLGEVYAELAAPAAKANVLRAAILAAEGGVYLDADTVTVRSFDELRRAGAFCGVERLALPFGVRRSRNPLVWAAAGLKLLVRDVLRRWPWGYRAFRRVARWYPAAPNNAVLGAERGHPFVVELLCRMIECPRERRRVRYALGTHLLGETVAATEGAEVVVHPPRRFYPLPPEISEHWFRVGRRPSLGEVLAPETVAVHWYASVRTARVVPRIDPAYVRAHAGRQLWSALALPFTA
ncbi:MAG: glycosyl transferase [Myxococcales bacterium]|nr:glycosyl transferase [Myxococcales bacterium]